MEKLKQFKAIYTMQFTAKREDAVRIAELHKPNKTELENVIEVNEKVSDLFKDLGNIFNPANANKKYKRS